jgi:hypothetical protein
MKIRGKIVRGTRHAALYDFSCRPYTWMPIVICHQLLPILLLPILLLTIILLPFLLLAILLPHILLLAILLLPKPTLG